MTACLSSLAANQEAATTDIIIYCDGPRNEKDLAAIAQVRDVAHGTSGFGSVRVVVRDENIGLAESVVRGVTDALTWSDRVIVIEDDLEVARGFLTYMNGALDLYADDDEVASIHGYCYPVATGLPETFFLRGADCWGWATWRRAWQFYEPNPCALLSRLEDERLTHQFDLDGAYPYTDMLRDRIAGRNDSWAILWHASAFLRNMLTLHPGRSMVRNIGNDGSGTHNAATERFHTSLPFTDIALARIAKRENAEARNVVKAFMREPMWKRVARRVRSVALR